MVISAKLSAPRSKIRNSAEWFMRAKLAVAAARDRAIDAAQGRQGPSIRPPTALQRRRLARFIAKNVSFVRSPQA